MEEEHELLNICPHHRAGFGIRWRTGKSVCTVPAEMAAHKSANAKGSYRVNSHQSALILEETKILIPVGSRELFLSVAYSLKCLQGLLHTCNCSYFGTMRGETGWPVK